MADGESVFEGGAERPGKKKKRSKRKRRSKDAELPDWDASAGKWKTTRSTKRLRKSKIAVLGLLALVSTALVYVVFNPADGLPAGVAGGDDFFNESSPDLEEAGFLSFGNDGEIDLPSAVKLDDALLSESAERIARQFLAADSVDEMLPLVRQTKDIGEKMRSYYREREIEKVKIFRFDSSGAFTFKDRFVAVDFSTVDFEARQMAFIQAEDGLRVDWESWVGWSEVPWSELLDERPSKPVLLRAMLTWVDYYNFDFSDESDWRSFRLTPAGGEPVIYGYVPRNSALDQVLRPRKKNQEVAVTLEIRFRDDESNAAQVMIEGLLAQGWVLPDF